MTRTLLSVLVMAGLACASSGAAKNPSTGEVAVDRIPGPGGDVTCYRMSGGDRGMVLYLQGSEYQSQRSRMGNLQLFAALGFDAVVCEKPGVSEGQTDTTSAFSQATLPRRVESTSTALAYYRSRLKPGAPVVLFAASEGGDVAARVAKAGGATHLILLGTGSGMSQAEEFRTLVRKNGECLGMRSEDELSARLEEIRASTDDDQLWAGHPHRRWKSYLFESPLPFLLQVDAPILLVQGTADTSVPVESARAAKAAFAAAGKASLTLHEVEGADHSFTDVSTGQPRIFDVIGAMADWMAEQELIGRAEGEQVVAGFREAMKQ